MIRRRLSAPLLPVLFALLLALPFYWRLDSEEFHGDESHWISSGQQALALLAAGGWHDPQWREEFYFFSQPQVGKVLIGLALRGAGIWGPSPIYDYDWQLLPAENRAIGRVPAPEAVAAGRIVGATAGWVACLALWGLGAALGAPRAGAAGALLLASHPLWLANSRRAGLDAPALALGLLAALLAVWALRPALRILESPGAAGGRPPVGGGQTLRSLAALGMTGQGAAGAPGAGRAAPAAWAPLLPLLLAGATAGLAVGTKYVALLALPVALVPFAAALRRASGRARTALLVAAPLSLLVGGAVFWATNPALYPDPIGGLRVSLDFLTTQAAGMRWGSPVFQHPALVAVEVIDRTVWPLGFPPIVDQTLPRPLSPGSYGTPVVALGALGALLALARPALGTPGLGSRFPHLSAAVWTGVVYLALVLSVPIWWERWHLPLVLPLCLLAGLGLAWLGRGSLALTLLPAAAQLLAALAMGPSYLGKGFGALLGTPLGAALQVLALTALLVHFTHVSVSVREHARQG